MTQGCMPKLTHPMYGYAKQNKNEIIGVRVSEKINYYTELSTKNYREITKGEFQSFDALTTPEDMIRCNEKACHMTGTLYVKPVEGEATVTYDIRGDYTKAGFGFHYLYVTFLGSDTVTVEAKVSDLHDVEGKNSYTYAVELTGAGLATDVFQVAQFDFANPLSIKSQTGTGWIPSEDGIHVEYTIKHKDKADALVKEPFGISSIKTIACKNELHKSDNVLISCLESFTHGISLGASDARCFGSGYDPSSTEITTSISGATRSLNDFWLNPLESKGGTIVAGIPTTRVFTVKGKTVNGTEYGYIELADLYPTCNSVIISLGENCNGVYLEPLQVPSVTPVDHNEFVAISNVKAQDFGTVYVNKKYINREVLVTYDAEKEVEHFEANEDRLDSFEAEFTVPRVATNGKREYLRFYGIITSHSEEFNNSDEVNLSLEVTFVRRNGKFYDRYVEA